MFHLIYNKFPNAAKRPFAAVASSVRRASGIVQTGEVIGENFEARFYVGRTGVAVLVNWGSLLQSAIAAQRRHDDPQEREPAITSPSPPTKTSRKGRYPTPSTVAGCVIRELYVRAGHPRDRVKRGRAREVQLIVECRVGGSI